MVFNMVTHNVIDFVSVGVSFPIILLLISWGDIFVVFLLFEIFKIDLRVLCEKQTSKAQREL